jgi:POT family proton-dependent oligopeptide transporter
MTKFVSRKFLGRDFFGHPSGLYVLFFTEMWERFSYYGMRSLLVLYMTQYLFFEPDRAADVLGYTGLYNFLAGIFGQMTVQQMSSQLYGLYTGFVYFTPFFGGMIADRLIGKHRSVYIGATLMAIGHFLMASEQLFFIALLFIIFGYGFFKPNLSTQVGFLYQEGDKRIDSAFGIYYMGVNTGALLSPFVCGTLGEKIGWHWGFGAAGVGMVLSMIFYWMGSGLIPRKEILFEKKLAGATQDQHKVPLTRKEWNAVIALGVLCLLNITFWAIYEQQGNVLQLWAENNTDWVFFGWEAPSTWFQAFNPLIIIFVTPLLISFWTWQNKRKWEPSSITKMGIGCLLCGCAYIFMILAAKAIPAEGRGSILWLWGTTFVFTIGELYLSPIGLSLVVQVAPKRIVGAMMGLWFMSSFFGNYLTGYLGTFYETMPKERFFLMLFGLGIAAGVSFFILRRPIDKAIGKQV